MAEFGFQNWARMGPKLFFKKFEQMAAKLNYRQII